MPNTFSHFHPDLLYVRCPTLSPISIQIYCTSGAQHFLPFPSRFIVRPVPNTFSHFHPDLLYVRCPTLSPISIQIYCTSGAQHFLPFPSRFIVRPVPNTFSHFHPDLLYVRCPTLSPISIQVNEHCVIRRFLTEDATKTLVTSYILSRLDYCNCLLMGTPNSVIQPLQKIQNFAARLVLLAPRHHHATPLLEKLHWLPISERIKYKVACMCFGAINGSGPAYLSELLGIDERMINVHHYYYYKPV